jgi:hypothetical protein
VLDYTGVDATTGGESLDRARSLLSADYRDFAAVPADNRARLAHDDGDLDGYAFVDYHRPVVELRQLESKASDAGITLETDSRYYSRMRAARRPDGKYIRNERIPDEAYRLDSDPGETEPVDADDPVVGEVLAALERFEARAADEWDDRGADAEAALEGMDETAKERLQDLGYVE